MIIIIFFILSFTVAIECDQYRSDYTYDENAQGWFKLHRIPATWDDAKLRCSVEGAVLASPENKKMMTSMMQFTKSVGWECGVFTGVNARYAKGDFYSIQGVPLQKMPVQWMPFEPDNMNNNEECIALTSNGTIADVNCFEVLPYICYKKAPRTVPLNECGTSDSEYKLFSKTGNCYKFHTTPRNFTQAFTTCSAEGGYLAIPNTKEEAMFLKDLFNKNVHRAAKITKYKETMFLGLIDFYQNGVWTTIHGSPLEEIYFEWHKDQPSRSGQFCGAMYQDGSLDDLWCDKIAPFTCEKDINSLMDDTSFLH